LRDEIAAAWQLEDGAVATEAQIERQDELEAEAAAWTRDVERWVRKREKRGLKHVPVTELEAQILILERKPSSSRRLTALTKSQNLRS
jgi:hypothetical protein